MAVATPTLLIESWGQLGAWAIVGGAFLFVIRWLMTQFQKALERNTTHLAVQSLLIVSLQKQLLAHDLTVSGLNPHSGSDIDERTNKGYMKYRELHKDLGEVQRMIRSEFDKLG